MDTWKLICLSYAIQIHPEDAQEAIDWAKQLHAWLSEDAPFADDETEGDMEVIFTPEGTEH